MQLRRFTGDSMPTALGAVRQALGDEAIILSNRSVDGRIEIVATAMLDERALAAAKAFEPAPPASAADTSAGAPASPTTTDLAAPRPAAPSVTAWMPASASASVFPDVAMPTSGQVDSANDAIGANAAIRADGASGALDDGGATGVTDATGTDGTDGMDGMDGMDGTGGSEASDVVAPVTLERRVQAPVARDAGATASPSDANAVTGTADDAFETLFLRAERQHETRAARLEERLRRLEVNLWGELEPLRAMHLRQLLRLGIGAELGVRLAESVVAGSTPEAAMRRSLALLKASLPIASDTTGVEPGVTVLSGPEGGGKSTALVKLATRQVQREGNQSVVMIAADNRRIGAFESLQVYGRLLGVPVVQAHDGAELASLIEAFSHKSLVLVDHVPAERRETMPLPAPESLGQRDGAARRLRHLMVLPATLESRAFEALVERHVELGVTGGILTRLDRASRLGVCLAPLVRHQLGIAYWSDNARVQTPLEKASASVLVATVMSTGAQLAPSVDEELLLDLLQPTRRDVGETLAPGAAGVAVSATEPAPAPAPASLATEEHVR